MLNFMTDMMYSSLYALLSLFALNCIAVFNPPSNWDYRFCTRYTGRITFVLAIIFVVAFIVVQHLTIEHMGA